MATDVRDEKQADQSKETIEQVKDVVTGHDEPMAEKKPGWSAALVFLTYPALIIGAVLIAFALISWF